MVRKPAGAQHREDGAAQRQAEHGQEQSSSSAAQRRPEKRNVATKAVAGQRRRGQQDGGTERIGGISGVKAGADEEGGVVRDMWGAEGKERHSW